MLATPRWKRQSYCEKSWSGTTLNIKYGPYICDQCLWIDALLHILGETTNFRKSQIEAIWCPKTVQSSAICDHFDYCMLHQANGKSSPELVCGWSRDHKLPLYDIRSMTPHFFRNVSFACYPFHVENDCRTMKNRGLGPLGPSILDPVYVIYAFG